MSTQHTVPADADKHYVGVGDEISWSLKSPGPRWRPRWQAAQVLGLAYTPLGKAKALEAKKLSTGEFVAAAEVKLLVKPRNNKPEWINIKACSAWAKRSIIRLEKQAND